MRRAGMRARLVAGGIDLIVAWAVAAAVSLAAMQGYTRAAGEDAMWPWPLLILSAPCAYMAAEVVAGRAVGKVVMKLRILRPDRRPAGRARLAVRLLLKLSPLLAPVLFSLALFAAAEHGPAAVSRLAHRAFDVLDIPEVLMLVLAGSVVIAMLVDLLPILAPRRQALHDRLSDTAVLGPGEEPSPPHAFEVISQPESGSRGAT